MSEFYSPQEIDTLRRQIREGNRLTKRAAEKRGYALHPRLAARREPAPGDEPAATPEAGER